MKNLFKTLAIGTVIASMSITSYAGSWKFTDSNLSDRIGWWYQNDDGSYLRSDSANAVSWHWIDGDNDGIAECYAFDSAGWAYTNTTTIDGYTVNSDGAWTLGGVVQTQNVGTNQSSSSDNSSSEYSEYDFEYLFNLYYGNDSSSSASESDSSYSTSYSSEGVTAEDVVEAMNVWRKKQKVDTLELDDELTEMAEIRAEEAYEYWSHTRPDGTSFSTVIDEIGDRDNYTGVAENLYKGSSSAWGVSSLLSGYSSSFKHTGVDAADLIIEAWNSSSGHKATMKGKNYTSVGIGIYEAEGMYYVSAIFAY